MSDVTRILSQIESGNPSAAEQLLPLVYDELRKLAAAKLAQEKPGQTLQATALVHEAYVRLVESKGAGVEAPAASEAMSGDAKLVPGHRPLAPPDWNSRGHFFAAAAEAMRRILVEQARFKRSSKGGGDRQRVELTDVPAEVGGSQIDLLALHEALQQLETVDPRKAALIKLRFFAGLSNVEAASALGISSTTADNDWAYAKTWLRLRMAGE